MNITVLYHGSTTYENFAREAHHYHFLVLLSKDEHWGNAIYEAMSLALPVIISRFTPWEFTDKKDVFLQI